MLIHTWGRQILDLTSVIIIIILQTNPNGICLQSFLLVCLMVFNATFNNISAISWRSVLLVEETGGSGENHRPVQITDKLYHIMLYTSPWSRFQLTTSVVIGIGSCKSNYHTITEKTAPQSFLKAVIYKYCNLGNNMLWLLVLYLSIQIEVFITIFNCKIKKN